MTTVTRPSRAAVCEQSTLSSVPDRGDRSQPAPLDPPMVPLMVAGTVIWAVIGLGLLAAAAPSAHLRTCLAGFLFGVAMTGFMWARDRRRRRRTTATGRDRPIPASGTGRDDGETNS